MFYVKWFGQFTLVMVLAASVALLVPPPAIAGLMLIVVIAWALWLLNRLVRHFMAPASPAPHDATDSSPDLGLGAQVVLTDSLVPRTLCSPQPPVKQRPKAEDAAGDPRTCALRIRTRLPRDFRGRSIPLPFVYCRVRRRPAA